MPVVSEVNAAERSEADLLLELAGDETLREARARARSRLEALREEALDVLEQSLRSPHDRPLRVAAAREVLDLIGVRVSAPPPAQTSAAEVTTEPGLRLLRRDRARVFAGVALVAMSLLFGVWFVTSGDDAPARTEPKPAFHAEPAPVAVAPAPPVPAAPAPKVELALPPASEPVPHAVPAPAPQLEPAAAPSAPMRVRHEPAQRPAPVVKRVAPVTEVRATGAELASSAPAGMRGRQTVGRLGIQMNEADF